MLVVEDVARARPVVDHLVPQAVKLHRRVFVEDDPVEIVDVELQRVQRGADRPHRKARIVLDAAQPLLVDREPDRIVIHHRERAVVVVAGNSHYQHVTARVRPRGVGGDPAGAAPPQPAHQRHRCEQPENQRKPELTGQHSAVIRPSDK